MERIERMEIAFLIAASSCKSAVGKNKNGQ